MFVSHIIPIFDVDKIIGFIAGGRLCVALRSEEIFVFFTSNQLINRSPTVQSLGYTSGIRKTQIKFALASISKGLSHDLIVELTGLLLSEVQLVAEGKSIDVEEDTP